MRILPVFLFISVVGLCRAQAQLSWGSDVLDLDALPNDRKVSGNFVFTNESDKTTTISSVKTSCGCTTAALEKMTYEPGESGKILASLNVSRTGVTEKKIYVRYGEGDDSVKQLTIRANVPELIAMTPARLVWRRDEKKDAKSITVKVKADYPINVLTVASKNADFLVKLGTVRAGRKYEVVVTPPSAEGCIGTVITVQTDYPLDKPQAYTAHARIMAVLPQNSDGFFQRLKNRFWRWIAK